MSKCRVLIVEESKEAALELQKKLLAIHCEVIAAVVSTDRAIEAIDGHLPDLVLININLHGVGKGVDAVEQIREKHPVPVIYLSAKTDRATLQRVKSSSVFGYIPKPVDINTLESVIELALSRLESDEKLAQKYAEIRLELIEYSRNHSLGELLTKALDMVGAFVDSPIGFYHFVEPDQQTLSLQQWSTRTLKEFCQAEARGLHYSIDKAGVWVDCVKAKKPVIHNDYESLPHKRGMPEGHAQVIRELVVPVIRKDKVVAILGVGNKPRDYTQKDVDIVNYLADVTWQIIAGKKADVQLHKSIQDWEKTFDAVNAAIWILDDKQKIVRTNKVAEEIFQKSSVEIIGCQCWEIAHGCQHQIEDCPIPRAKKSKSRESMELQMGDEWFEVVVDPILTSKNTYNGAVHIVTNITARKEEELEREKLQQQLLQAQKMEAIGRLAGGVAHDFNNMLGVILGYTELTMRELRSDDKAYTNLAEIHEATNRSVDLVRQLLAFARRQTALPKVLDLNVTVESLLSMMRRLIGEDINLVWVPGASLQMINIDPAQLDQILANLCVNARDAIAGVGKITVQTRNITIDETYCRNKVGFIPGDYVALIVSDDGCGMSRETVRNIFEPFYTTKEDSKGTGLGLATVYGIVKQNNGFINVYSEPDQGTTFKIYFPKSEKVTLPIRKQIKPVIKEGVETILIVEDEEAILRLSMDVLSNFGYTVLAAKNPKEALALVESQASSIDLLITDVVMPEMNGKELVDQILAIRSAIKVIYMSGYTSDVIVHRGILQDDVHFLQKPFSVDSITTKVRAVLDQVDSP